MNGTTAVDRQHLRQGWRTLQMALLVDHVFCTICSIKSRLQCLGSIHGGDGWLLYIQSCQLEQVATDDESAVTCSMGTQTPATYAGKETHTNSSLALRTLGRESRAAMWKCSKHAYSVAKYALTALWTRHEPGSTGRRAGTWCRSAASSTGR